MIGLTFSDFSSRTKIGALYLDVLVSEEINLEGDVTLYPVETGSLITDHIFEGAERIRISGLVSSADMAMFSFGGPGKYKLTDAVDTLRSMHKARALVDVFTGQMMYTDMGITSLRAVRTNGDRGGNWLDISAELVKVRKVTLKTAEVPEAPAQGAAKGRAGETNKPAGKTSGTSTSASPTEVGSGPANVTPFRKIVRDYGTPSREFLEKMIERASGR